jgi:hypothetical protein
MLLTSLLAYLVGGATLGISYWEFPYLIVVFSMVLRLLGEQARQAAQESSGFFTRPDIAPRNQG